MLFQCCHSKQGGMYFFDFCFFLVLFFWLFHVFSSLFWIFSFHFVRLSCDSWRFLHFFSSCSLQFLVSICYNLCFERLVFLPLRVFGSHLLQIMCFCIRCWKKRCCCCCTSGGGLPEKSPCCLSWLWMRWMVLVLVAVRGNLKKTWGRARYLASRCIAASMMIFFLLEPVGVPASGCFQVPCPPNDVLLLERKCSFCCCGCSWRATFKDFLLSINVVGIVNAGGERRQPLKK